MKRLITTTALISTLFSATAVEAGKFGNSKSGGLSKTFNSAAGNKSGGKSKAQSGGRNKFQRPAGKTPSPKRITPIFKRAAEGGGDDGPPPPPPTLRPRGPTFNPK